MAYINAERARRALDRRFAGLPPADALAAPPRGWIRAIRDALGMSAAQLGARLGVQQSRVSRLEQAECSGAVTLASLERAADALGCDLRYVLVPRQPLEQTVRSRATELARRDMARVQHTMALEDQATDGADVAATLDDLANDCLRSRKLWDDR